MNNTNYEMFTEAQRKVILFDEGNIVVSASAGSGKTSVMIERIIRLICEGKTDISRILAVTFTKNSAEEIKARVTKAIIKVIRTTEDAALAKRLTKQLPLLKTAAFSTIDSFCSGLIKRYFYSVDIDPSFSVLDSADGDNLRARAIDNLVEKLFDKGDENIKILIEVFLNKRSDRNLKDLILRLYGKTETEKNIDEYFEKALSNYLPSGVENTVNRAIALFISKLDFFIDSIRNLLVRTEGVYEKYYKFLSDKLNYLIELKKIRELAYLKEAIKMPQAKKPSTKKDADEEELIISEEVGGLNAELKKLFVKFTPIFDTDIETEKRKAESVYKVCAALYSCVKAFAAEYSSLKRDLNALDYSDLEHFAYKILQNEELRREIQQEYDYIFVDEFQDTNGIQEAIFSQLENNNLFIVGDAKQSIYAFRGCDCDIFKRRLENAKANGGERVDLDSNFRSARSVIDAVNRTFSAVMLPETAKISYKEFPMEGGKNYGDYLGLAELIVLPKREKESCEELSGVYSVKKHLETLKKSETNYYESAIADVVERELGQQFFDVKLGKMRVVLFSDITVLTRKNKGTSDRLSAELIKRGIPVNADSKRNIGEYYEIKIMQSLIEYLVNQSSDIALATLLKSPFGNFSDGELKKIREKYKSGSFVAAATRFQRCEGELSERLKEFFGYFNKLRLLQEYESAAEIMERAVRDRNFETGLLAYSYGEARYSRVLRLIDAAARGGATVFELYKKLPSLIKGLTVSQISGDNAVQIMSQHSSKGLEFPIVILAELNETFNTSDYSEEVIFDREEGLGIKYYEPNAKLVSPTIMREFVAYKKKFDGIAEEMRLFYVAMTRAKAKLILVSKKEPSHLHYFSDYCFATSMLDFIAKSDMNVVYENEIPDVSASVKQETLIFGAPSEKRVNDIKAFLDFKYPHLELTKARLKRTVTQIAKSSQEEDAFDFDERFSGGAEDEPIIIDGKKITAAERGTAFHKFMELSDFTLEPKKEAERLYNSGLISELEHKLILAENPEKILNTDLFKRISGYKLLKEQAFIVNVPKEKYDGNEGESLVQGVIDLVAENGENAIIIDYKRSRLNSDALKLKYSLQVELYAFAVEKLLNKRVTEKYLVNLLSGEIISV